MRQDTQVLRKLYNVFDPFRPLSPGDPAYVDCQEVRGDSNILEELGRGILLSDRPTCQLYAGHRGVGKSTELLRLRKYLEENNFKVIYFAVDEEDIDPEDAQYTDVLLACTRHLLEELKKDADPSPLTTWLKARWQSLKDLAMAEVVFDKLDVSAQVGQFAKLTANLRAVPSARQKIREQVDAHTISLIEALNEFITNAVRGLRDEKDGIVVITDNLDRIVHVVRDEDTRHSSHDEIFLDRSEQLRALRCHVVYTVPISMVYSSRGTVLEDRYGKVQVLPMIKVRTSNNHPYPAGLQKLEELIKRRVKCVASDLSLEEVFDENSLRQLCILSGGHVRNLLLLLKTAIERTSGIPIQTRAIDRAIGDLRSTYRGTINEEEWAMLAHVHLSKQMPNQDEYRKLLFNRCILEYREQAGDILRTWHDVHPLIEKIEQFRKALSAIED
jgi:hypothetical protein